MYAGFNMFKFSKSQESWLELEQLLYEHYQTKELRYVCRMTEELHKEGFEVLTVPSYNFEGCKKEKYRSFLLSTQSKLPDSPRVAINHQGSYSGQIAFDTWLESKTINESSRIETGSHIDSVKALINSEVELACVDCISWGFIQKEIPESKKLFVIDQTPLTDGHPILIKKSHPSFSLKVSTDLLKSLNITSL